jgi:G3E family GTPase
MTKADIFSGFLGAGKTTLIKKLVAEAFSDEKIVIIENEFGEIGIDSAFLSEAGVNITEMNSGCICCSLVGDFGVALKKVLDDFSPDRVLIEPSGVGKPSDVIKAVENAGEERLSLNSAVAVIDAKKCKVYMKNFGEFFNNQIEHAQTIILSHTAGLSNEKIAEAVKLIREHNENALIVTTDWNELDGKALLESIERSAPSLADELKALEDEAHREHHHHHHHDHDEECECGHHHHHDHGHHHADEVFTSWGKETARKYTREELEAILKELDNIEKYGYVLRAKGYVAGDNCWYYFDFTPEDPDIRTGTSAPCGRLCVIGSKINTEALEALFN